MTNLDCALAVLMKHSKGCMWPELSFVVELLAQLGLELHAEAKNAANAALVFDDVNEDRVHALEAAARVSIAKYQAALDATHAQRPMA